jgi:hypothetical protein
MLHEMSLNVSLSSFCKTARWQIILNFSEVIFQRKMTLEVDVWYQFSTDLGVVACALSEGRRVEAIVSHFVEPTHDLTSEVRGGSRICPCRPRDSNILADRKSCYNEKRIQRDYFLLERSRYRSDNAVSGLRRRVGRSFRRDEPTHKA